jgi:hypothetical protein
MADHRNGFIVGTYFGLPILGNGMNIVILHSFGHMPFLQVLLHAIY